MFKRAQHKPTTHHHHGGGCGGVQHKRRRAKNSITPTTPTTITTSPAQRFSTTSSQSGNKQPVAVFPMATTADNAALASLPEYKQYEAELSHGRLVNAEQFLSRIDNIFTHLPMPSVHVELGLKKAHLAMQQSKHHHAAQLLENNLKTLSTALPFTNNTYQEQPPQSMSPRLTLPKIVVKKREAASAEEQSTAHILNNILTGYNNTQLEATYLPMITTLTTLYLQQGQYHKAQDLVTTWGHHFALSAPPSTTQSVSGAVLMQSLQGLIHQTKLTEALREYILQTDMKTMKNQMQAQLSNNTTTTTTTTPTTPEPQVKPKPKPKFILKTTSVKTSAETNTAEKSGDGAADVALQSNDEILKKKQQEQEAMIKEQEAQEELKNQSSIPQHSHTKTKKSTFSTDFLTQLLQPTTPMSNTVAPITEDMIDNMIDSALFVELSSLPPLGQKKEDPTSPPPPLLVAFKHAFKSYLLAINTINQSLSNFDTTQHTAEFTHNQVLALKTMKLDVLSHISSLFATFTPYYVNVGLHDSVLEQHCSQLLKINNAFLHHNVFGYEGLVLDQEVAHFSDNNNNNNHKISPLHITPHGLRCITTNLSVLSQSLILTNMTLKVADHIHNFAQHVDDTDPTSVSIFKHIENNKGTVLSPLLSAISTEYLSLNPVNAEGLIRTAIKYLEKQPLTTHATKQLLLDLHLNNAFIVSNLSWNGKTRQREAINMVLNVEKMKTEFNNNNNNNNQQTPITPRYFAYDIKQVYTSTQDGGDVVEQKSLEDIMGEIALDADAVKNYEVLFKHLPPHNEEWVNEKYCY